MTKRIPCRIIRSVPLSKSGYVAGSVGGPGNKWCKATDFGSVGFETRGGGGSDACGAGSGIARLFAMDDDVEQVLDCYV
ncbi:MAG: hypothetical protein ACYS76_00050 [Planctomycetota bacterium]|jgi:hypothetical protein